MLAKTILQNKGRIFMVLFVINVLFFGFQYVQYSKTKALDTKGIRKNRKSGFSSLDILTPVDKVLNSESRKKVVLRLMKNDCQECMDSIYTNTLRLTKKFGKGSVHVLINGDFDESQFLSIRRIFQYDFNVYYVREKVTALDVTGDSYYFLFDKKRPSVAKHIFRIRGKDAGYTSQYLSWLLEL